MENLAGLVIGDTGEVQSPLGRGGMGSVWLVRNRRVAGKQAAIKVLREGSLKPELQVRFQREAEIAARLEHPNIVQVFDAGTLPSGQPYIVMEYLRGESLKARLLRGPILLDALKPLVLQLCSALHVAHEHGVVHRDLKPDNIFLVPTPTGDQVKVLDFGISKVLGSDTVETSDSVLIGTPMYMSPEQAMGENTVLTARSDLFSLATICYEALAGRAPFRASGVAQVVHRILYTEPDELTDLEAGAMAALRHALRKEPAARTPDVATFAHEFTGRSLGLTGSGSMPLVALSAPSDQETRQSRPVRPAAPTVERPRSRVALGVAAAGLLVAAAVLFVTLGRPAPSSAEADAGGAALTAQHESAAARDGSTSEAARDGAPSLLRDADAGRGDGIRSDGIRSDGAGNDNVRNDGEGHDGVRADVRSDGVRSDGVGSDGGGSDGGGSDDGRRDAGLADAGTAPRGSRKQPVPAADEPPLDAAQTALLESAERALAAGNFTDTLTTARRSPLATSGRARALETMAACGLGNLGLANATFARVPPRERQTVRAWCRGKQVELQQ